MILFSGRCVTGPLCEILQSLFVQGILTFVELTWFFSCLPFLTAESEFEEEDPFPNPTKFTKFLDWLIFVMTITIHLLALKSQCTDPGIINRGPKIVNTTNNVKKDGSSQADYYKHRYCDTCNIMRPPRASHCRDCDCCITDFDHHCALVNNCIGVRNMRSFVLALFLLQLVAVLYFTRIVYLFYLALSLGKILPYEIFRITMRAVLMFGIIPILYLIIQFDSRVG